MATDLQLRPAETSRVVRPPTNQLKQLPVVVTGLLTVRRLSAPTSAASTARTARRSHPVGCWAMTGSDTPTFVNSDHHMYASYTLAFFLHVSFGSGQREKRINNPFLDVYIYKNPWTNFKAGSLDSVKKRCKSAERFVHDGEISTTFFFSQPPFLFLCAPLKTRLTEKIG